MRDRSVKDISDKDLMRLLSVVADAVGTPTTIRMRADLVFSMAKELARLRDELFRIRVCDTVDEMINIDELFSEDD